MTATRDAGLVRIAPMQARPDELSAALRRLWQAACGDGCDVARAMTMNFVAVADATDEPTLRDVTERLFRRSPARAFLLLLDDARSEPEVTVAAVTRSHGSTRDVVLEEIRAELPRAWFEHVPGIVRPLLLNDIPTHLFWVGDRPGDDADFAALRELADHLVVDSARFSVPGVLPAEPAGEDRVTDLSWLRLRPWRRALAEAFEQLTWQPGTPTTGVVRHGADASATAILLARWLEDRLDAGITLEESGPPGEPCPESVALRFDGCEIDVTSDARCLTVHVTTDKQCFLPFRLPRSNAGTGDLLAAAIDIA